MTLLIKASFEIGGRINDFESKDYLLNNQKSQLMKSSTYVIISFNSSPFLDPFNMDTCETANPIVVFFQKHMPMMIAFWYFSCGTIPSA